MGLSKPIKDDERIQKLYAEGPLFLYGMIFHRSFSFKSDLVPTWAHDPDVFSIGLHSCHLGNDLVGSDVTSLVDCINKLQALPQANGKRCLLYVMSDREATIANLGNHTGHNCTVAAVTRAEKDKHRRPGPREHGPFAGVGFFKM